MFWINEKIGTASADEIAHEYHHLIDKYFICCLDMIDGKNDPEIIYQKLKIALNQWCLGRKVIFFCFAGISRCYDKETQILSKKGWKYFYELESNEEVMTLNLNTENMEWQKPLESFQYDYEGKLISLKNGMISLVVTPNHRLVFFQNNKYSFTEAQTKRTHVQIPRIGKWVTQDKEFFNLPRYSNVYNCSNQYGKTTKRAILRDLIQIRMDDWLVLLGIYLSEGCLIKKWTNRGFSYGIQIAQKNDEKRKILKENLASLPFHIGEDKQSLRIWNIQLYQYFKQFGKAHDKFIPEDCKELSKRQLTILLKWLIFGDGHDYGTHWEYDSVSTRLLDNVQEIAIKTGYSANLIKNGHDGLKVSISKTRTKAWIDLKKQYEEIDYSGKVYCLSVPNQVLLIRRKGRTCFSGNSNGMATTLIAYYQNIDWEDAYTLTRKACPRAQVCLDFSDSCKIALEMMKTRLTKKCPFCNSPIEYWEECCAYCWSNRVKK